MRRPHACRHSTQSRRSWLEEPFAGHAIPAYHTLSRRGGRVKLAGGEASHNVHLARHLIDDGGIGFIQIDCGRIGGIAPALEVARHAAKSGVTYVNHTFTSHLALSASLQPFAGLVDHRICEYPFAPKALARALTVQSIHPDGNGEVRAPKGPGLGMDVESDTIRRYLVETEIKVRGEVLYATPTHLARSHAGHQAATLSRIRQTCSERGDSPRAIGCVAWAAG